MKTLILDPRCTRVAAEALWKTGELCSALVFYAFWVILGHRQVWELESQARSQGNKINRIAPERAQRRTEPATLTAQR